MARALRCGQVFVNKLRLQAAGIELPFARQALGHGREQGLRGAYGFSTLKTIAIHHG